MTTTMEEVAGWLREAANDHKLRACFSETSSGAFTHLAKGEEYLDRAAQVEAMGWRPISEAPKDGTIVDIFNARLGTRIPNCRMFKGMSGYIDGHNWVGDAKDVTHFMPIPKPPVNP